MLRKLMRYATVPLLTLTLVLWGCENADQVLGPQAASKDTGSGKAGYVQARENDPTVGTVSAVIGTAGGRLFLGKNSLEVPAGAVSAPTTFTMSKTNSDLRFELTATRYQDNDVGAAGFAVPLKLTIDYSKVDLGGLDEQDLAVFWKKDGEYIKQPSFVDGPGKRLIGSITHFSTYCGGVMGFMDSLFGLL